MATRDYRLAEFNDGEPPLGKPLQLLAEDHNGTYLLPFPCGWRDGVWYNAKSSHGGKPVAATIVGWRAWRYDIEIDRRRADLLPRP